jgi:hypothetical protein
VTLAWYEEAFKAQNGLCGICKQEGFVMDPKKHRTKLVVDHCHRTNAVRGLLCHNCNRALGLFKDSKESLMNAISYIEGATTIETPVDDAGGSRVEPSGSKCEAPLLAGDDIV